MVRTKGTVWEYPDMEATENSRKKGREAFGVSDSELG